MEPGWILLASACLGAGVFVLLRTFDRWEQGASVPKDFRRWHDELEVRALAAIQADMVAAECRVSLIRLIGKLPADYDPTALLACNVAAGVHRAVLENAERAGIVQKGSFERVYGPQEAFENMDADEPISVENAPTAGLTARPRWVGGRLVVR